MPDKSTLITVISCVCLVFIWTITPLRCYVRIFMKKSFGLDDFLAVLATIAFTIALIDVMLGSTYHVWQPWDVIPPELYERGLKVFFIGKILYGFDTCLIKLAFCVTLIRIAKERVHLWILYVVTGVTLSFSIFYLTFIISTCHPVSFFWRRAVSDHGHCRDPNKMMIASYVHGVIVFGVDFTLSLIPIFMVKDLKMDRITKITVAGILALGSVASIATIARIPYINRLGVTDNFVYKNIQIVIWSGLETCISIVCTGAATLRPLLAKVLPLPDSHEADSGPSGGLKNSSSGGSSQKRKNLDPYAGYDLKTTGRTFIDVEDSDAALELPKDASQVHIELSRPSTSQNSQVSILRSTSPHDV